MTTLTLCLLQNLLSFQSKFLLRSKVRFVPVGFVPFSLDNFLDLLQVAHKFIYKESHFKIIFQATKDGGRDLLCSSSRPQSFILLASCWAFFFSLQAREASLFFSLRDLVLLWKINKIIFIDHTYRYVNMSFTSLSVKWMNEANEIASTNLLI